ncbi:DnaB-like helicase C-terminal domain-containing protein [Streptomyces albidoflavus]|uniref:replicative DNA helicase n=1 Tax=Streptomyces albidoflavus TaxID=1886 RepID=UPI003448D2B4
MTTIPETRPAPAEDDKAEESTAAAAAVLGACLLATPSYDPVADAARTIEDSDWYDPAHELVWRAITALHGRSKPTGLPAVEAELRRDGNLAKVGGVAGLSVLASAACSSVEVEHYAHLVHAYARLRRYRTALVSAMQTARRSDPLEVTDSIAAHQAELEALAVDTAEDDSDFGRLGDRLDAHFDSLGERKTTASVTGFRDLDEKMITEPKQMIVVAGRPGMGKSAFGLGVALANARSGRPTLMYSLEMGETEVFNRILAARARVEYRHLQQGLDGLTEDDWQRLSRRRPELADLPLWLDYSARVSPARIRSRINALTRQTGQPPMVVIDYIQLMQTDQRSGNQPIYERVTEVSRQLKIVAQETDAVIYAVAQLNRASETRSDKKPQMADLRDSGALEQDANAIILLHRPDYYEPECARAGETDLIIAKHRGGSVGTVTVAHQFQYSRLHDLPTP